MTNELFAIRSKQEGCNDEYGEDYVCFLIRIGLHGISSLIKLNEITNSTVCELHQKGEDLICQFSSSLNSFKSSSLSFIIQTLNAVKGASLLSFCLIFRCKYSLSSLVNPKS